MSGILINNYTLPLVRMAGDQYDTGGIVQMTNGFADVGSLTIKSDSKIFLSYFGTQPADQYGRLYIQRINAGVSFTIASSNSDDSALISWFFLQGTDTVLTGAQEYSLLALDFNNGSYGTLTLSAGQATVNTPYAKGGHPIIMTPLREPALEGTVYTVLSIVEGVSFTVASSNFVDNAPLSYIIFAPNTSSQTVDGAEINYPLLTIGGDSDTYGTNLMTNSEVAIPTTSVTALSIPFASARFPVPTDPVLGLLYYEGATPGETIFFASDLETPVSYNVTWMFVDPT